MLKLMGKKYILTLLRSKKCLSRPMESEGKGLKYSKSCLQSQENWFSFFRAAKQDLRLST